MTYIEGFVCAVPTDRKDDYLKHAHGAAAMLADCGVARMIENWSDDLPEGKLTDFRKAVLAKDDESVVFSWFEYPDKETRDSANGKMMSDPRMAEMMESMPFDGKRMIMAGFESLVDKRTGGRPGYTDGYVVPVKSERKEDYRTMAETMAAKLGEAGALRVVEAWGDDVMPGEVTDFNRAVKANDGETVVCSFIEWPDKQTRDSGWEKVMNDPELQPTGDMPFDGKRMFWGGFKPILDTAAE